MSIKKHGNIYGDFISKNLNKSKEIFAEIGVSKLKMQIYFLMFQSSESINQIIAVFAGAKPMFYTTKSSLSGYGNLISLFLKATNKFNLKYYIKNQIIVIGKSDNVNSIIPEIDRINGKINNFDARWHYKIGIALGYPQKDVEGFVRNQYRNMPIID
jgi:hypothetical protein